MEIRKGETAIARIGMTISPKRPLKIDTVSLCGGKTATVTVFIVLHEILMSKNGFIGI